MILKIVAPVIFIAFIAIMIGITIVARKEEIRNATNQEQHRNRAGAMLNGVQLDRARNMNARNSLTTSIDMDVLPKYTPKTFSFKDLSHFPIISWSKVSTHENDPYSEDIVCKICHAQISSGVPIRSIPCSHVFHVSCLDNYLMNNSVQCPTCDLDLYLSMIGALESNNNVGL
ncbi:E3 ubiquitin-protein ligase [Zancudomyces culisetae]|uniref:E3 ubiquitin-protein ligase n=1 Tax=Zancudomyces culisetae TaxID=1213189 RepID=A0A1R1PW51_ZANCU|nr:E3 ubiquitin-protein ligase [Zancudomyces culisetae]|eukprot:OMH85143.1 E3 ubiquitin-protein ligase [Zancudomyces culisetae]